jgi:hypothetical protein
MRFASRAGEIILEINLGVKYKSPAINCEAEYFAFLPGRG